MIKLVKTWFKGHPFVLCCRVCPGHPGKITKKRSEKPMRKATSVVAATFGFLAGIAGLEHGIFEILQGNIHPVSFMFPSMGTPCNAAQVWHAFEPAMTILPNLLVAGILTVVLSFGIIFWSLVFLQRKHGGSLLILLSIVLLLVGGGFFPPLIGIAGGIAGTRINKPLGVKPAGNLSRFTAKLWPWPLVIFVIWLLGQYAVGYFANVFFEKQYGIQPGFDLITPAAFDLYRLRL
jgi:hypothetical protein